MASLLQTNAALEEVTYSEESSARRQDELLFMGEILSLAYDPY